MYRNVTTLGRGFRLSGTVTAEIESNPRPVLPYDPGNPGSTVFLNTALLHYRPSKTLEFAIGRDQLPSGINIPDLGPFIKLRQRFGYYDAPTQLKMFWGNKRAQVFPYVFTHGGNEPSGEAESGAGAHAEVDVLGMQRTVVGVSLLHGSAANGDRRTVGAYARLGFGRWGVLAEHDFTRRSRDVPITASFQQHVTYGQLFWAVREWLVASAIGERLSVQQPFEEEVNGARVEIAARFTPQVSLGVSARMQRNVVTNRTTTSVVLQGSVKTVQ
jgi:hypothetical protein